VKKGVVKHEPGVAQNKLLASYIASRKNDDEESVDQD